MAAFVQVCARCKTRPAVKPAYYNGHQSALCLGCYDKEAEARHQRELKCNREYYRRKLRNKAVLNDNIQKLAAVA